VRIGLVIPEFPTQTHVFFWREIEALRSLGAEVAILSTRRPALPCPHAFGPAAAAETRYLWPLGARDVLSAAGAPRRAVRAARYVAALTTGRARGLALAAAGARLAADARALGLDHLHAHSAADAAHVVALARLQGGPPFSVHVHGDLPVYGTDHALKLSGAAFVAAAAAPLRDQVVALGYPAARVHLMPMAVDAAHFTPRAPPRRPGALHVVTVSLPARCKGHRFALAALRELAELGVDVRYTIAGDGPDRAAISAEVIRLGLGARVAFAGSLGEDAVLALLRSADVFVLPSVGMGESFPVAVQEAMACGLPVVATRIGGTPDMIEDGCDGVLVPQEQPAPIARALAALARDPALRARMGAAARVRAEAEFDVRRRARTFLDVVEAARRAA
jgi:colanic acid/amylovoran biosynthesis glycosyltransferase